MSSKPMFTKILIGTLVLASAIPAVASTVVREQKDGTGTVRIENNRIDMRRMYVRLDDDGRVYLRLYPNAVARSFSGTYRRNGNRVTMRLTEGIERGGEGTVEYVNEANGRGRTFSSVTFRGVVRGKDVSVSFKAQNPRRLGIPNPTDPNDWNRRYDDREDGGWIGLGGARNNNGNNNDNDRWDNGNNYGNNNDWGDNQNNNDNNDNNGNWDNDQSINQNVQGDGTLRTDDGTTDIRRIRVTRNSNGDAVLSIETSRGTTQTISGDRSRFQGNDLVFTVDRAFNRNSTGTVRVKLDRDRKVISASGSGKRSNWDWSFTFRKD